jgi:hypothetical protein
MVFSALSKPISKRRDLLSMFEKTLNRNLDYILGQNSILLRSRVCLMLGYYLDILFNDYPDSFLNLIDFLFHSLTLNGNEIAITL